MKDPRLLPMAPPGGGSPSPVFDRVAIVGLGFVGGSIAMVTRERWPSALVIGVDRNEVLEHAIRLHAVDIGSADLMIAADVQLVVLAGSNDDNVRWLRSVPDAIDGPVLITDTGDRKGPIVRAAADLPRGFTFIGGHPIVEAAETALSVASRGLFIGAPWILVPGSAPADAVDRLSRFVSALGADPAIMTAEEHDRIYKVR